MTATSSQMMNSCVEHAPCVLLKPCDLLPRRTATERAPLEQKIGRAGSNFGFTSYLPHERRFGTARRWGLPTRGSCDAQRGSGKRVAKGGLSNGCTFIRVDDECRLACIWRRRWHRCRSICCILDFSSTHGSTGTCAKDGNAAPERDGAALLARDIAVVGRHGNWTSHQHAGLGANRDYSGRSGGGGNVAWIGVFGRRCVVFRCHSRAPAAKRCLAEPRVCFKYCREAIQ